MKIIEQVVFQKKRQKIFTYDNTGYKLELVKNKNIFNSIFRR